MVKEAKHEGARPTPGFDEWLVKSAPDYDEYLFGPRTSWEFACSEVRECDLQLARLFLVLITILAAGSQIR